ncbi:MAG TPA: hypothetical protein PLD59_06905, partial [Tepidisphaeraceae bacterium]|nr:hypothetical protein [Tepidisphaeraceae bacterium]
MRIVSLIFVTTLCTTVAAYSRDPSTRPDGNVVASMHDFTEALKRARPGDTVQTPFTGLATIPTLPLTISPVADAPQLLLADQPEYFRTGDGISMQETVKPGLVRLYLYHVPEPTGKPKIISAVVENLGGAPMTIQFHRYASPRPSGDYHKVATAAMQAFLQKQPAPDEIRLRQVAPNERLVIDPAIDQTAVKT